MDSTELIHQAKEVFSSALELGRQFSQRHSSDLVTELELELDAEPVAELQRLVLEFFQRVLALREFIQNPPEGLGSVTTALRDVAKVAREMRDTLQRERYFGALFEFFPELNSVGYQGWLAIQQVLPNSDPFAFVDIPAQPLAPVPAESAESAEGDAANRVPADAGTPTLPLEFSRMAPDTGEIPSDVLESPAANAGPGPETPEANVGPLRDELRDWVLDYLTASQRPLIRFLWDRKFGVDWNSLPSSGFRAGDNRTDDAVQKALERIQTRLLDKLGNTGIELQISPATRRVKLIRPRNEG